VRKQREKMGEESSAIGSDRFASTEAVSAKIQIKGSGDDSYNCLKTVPPISGSVHMLEGEIREEGNKCISFR
jgi:hypothetical protein